MRDRTSTARWQASTPSHSPAAEAATLADLMSTSGVETGGSCLPHETFGLDRIEDEGGGNPNSFGDDRIAVRFLIQ